MGLAAAVAQQGRTAEALTVAVHSETIAWIHALEGKRGVGRWSSQSLETAFAEAANTIVDITARVSAVVDPDFIS